MNLSRFLSQGSIKRNLLPLLVIILIWGVFILPSSFNPHLAYLDDPTTLLMAKAYSDDFHIPKPDGTSGRYFPAYFLYYALLFYFFGFNLTGYYAVQSLMFLLSLFLVYFIVFRLTRSILSGLLAVFLVTTASPVAENLYTFGKGEPRVLFYLLGAVYLFMLAEQVKDSRKTIRPALWIGIILLIIFAIFTKETSVVFFIFAAAGAAIGWLLNKNRDGINHYNIKPYLFLLAGSVCAILMTRGLFHALRPSAAISNYLSYSINLKIFLGNLKFYGSQQPDVLFLGLMTAVLAGVFYKIEAKNNVRSFIFVCALFLTGGAYILGLLIWRWPLGYYLLVPAAFFSITIAIMLRSLFRPSISNRIGYIAIVLILLTRVYSIPYFSFIAHAQKSQDKIYSEAISTYMQIANPGERLLVEEWPFFVEPVTQSNRLLKIFGKEHLIVAGVQDIINNMEISAETLKLYQVSEIPNREARYPRKNDYILTLTGNRQSPWVLRGISPFLNEKDSLYKMRGLELENIRKANIQWNVLELTVPFFRPKFRTYSAGYSLYKVLDPLPTVIWEGRWADDWIGNSAQCSLRISKQKKEFVFRGFVTEYTVPSLFNILKDNKIIKKVPLDSSGPFSFTVEIPSTERDGLFRIGFNAEKTFNPKDLGLSNDNRNLSIRLRVQDIETVDF